MLTRALLLISIFPLGCKRNNSETLTVSQDAFTDVQLNESCLEQLDLNPDAQCDVYIDPYSRLDVLAYNDAPSVPQMQGRDSNGILALTEPSSIEYLRNAGKAVLGNDTVCKKLQNMDIHSLIMKVSFGAEYSNIAMDAAEKAILQKLDSFNQPSLDDLSSSAASSDPNAIETAIGKTLTPYLNYAKDFGCSEYVRLFSYYSEATIKSRAASFANTLIRRYPFTDGGYRRNGEQRLIGRAIRNSMANRADRGRGIYLRIRDNLIDTNLGALRDKINVISKNVLSGSPLSMQLSTHETVQGQYWISSTNAKGMERQLAAGGLSAAQQQASAAFNDIKTKLVQFSK